MVLFLARLVSFCDRWMSVVTPKLLTVILFGHFKALFWSNFQSKIGLYFPNVMYFSTYFPNFIKYFPKCEGKGSFLKSQIKSLTKLGSNYIKHMLWVLKRIASRR